MTDLVTLEASLNTVINVVGDLNDDCQNLFDEVVELKDDVTDQISAAVTTSENAALVPLFTMATNLVTLDTTLINFIAASQP
jgi:hypothetical protein